LLEGAASETNPKTLLKLIADHAGQEKEKSLVTPSAKGLVAGFSKKTVHDMQAVRI